MTNLNVFIVDIQMGLIVFLLKNKFCFGTLATFIFIDANCQCNNQNSEIIHLEGPVATSDIQFSLIMFL